MRPLCQRGAASCGACCGMYNRRDLDRPSVRALLDRRTEALAAAPRTAAGFGDAAARLKAAEPAPLFPSVRVCPLLGWLDGERTRVGCLAHPLATGGPDLRDCGAYDVGTCEEFFCASHGRLGEEDAALAAQACGDDAYLYGLVITDAPFLRTALAAVAALAGGPVEARHLGSAPARGALRALLALKEELAPGSDGLFGYFAGGAGPGGGALPPIPAGAAPHEALLAALGADARSGNDAEALEEEVRRRLAACAAAMARGTSPP